MENILEQFAFLGVSRKVNKKRNLLKTQSETAKIIFLENFD